MSAPALDCPAGSVAVVATALRLPGADDVHRLWRNLDRGEDVIHDYTDAELDALGVPSPLRSRTGYVRSGGALLTPTDREGRPATRDDAADPQHDLFSRLVGEVLDALPGTRGERDGLTGLYAARGPNRHHVLAALGHPDIDAASWEELLPTGTEPDHLTARAAYDHDLTGPVATVQATCAGSLVAVCSAVDALLDYRCDLALAGGIHLTSPRHVRGADGVLSPDGRARVFDRSADGAGMSSGGVVLALRRAEDLAPGDDVLAVVLGHAVNNDGRSKAGYGAPSPAAQTQVVQEAQAAAGVSPERVGLVLAHAVGTPWGDALEVRALSDAWGGGTDLAACDLVAPKASLGNLDVASGVAALVVGALAGRHSRIPAMPHFRQASDALEVSRSAFRLGADSRPWRTGDPGRIVGVNAFGAGGTNAHVVLAVPHQGQDTRPT